MPIDESRDFVPVRIAVMTVSDTRTDATDRSGATLVQRLTSAGHHSAGKVIIADEVDQIEAQLRTWVDDPEVDVILTTGGTGPAPRDVTPDATLAVADRVLPGFGELMRAVSLRYVLTGALSRQLGVSRGKALILNLPGNPRAIAQILDGMFGAVPDCIELLGGPSIEVTDAVVGGTSSPGPLHRSDA